MIRLYLPSEVKLTDEFEQERVVRKILRKIRV